MPQRISLAEGAGSIELQALLQLLGWAASGGDAKRQIQRGLIRKNGVVETRRSHRILPGDVVARGEESAEVVGHAD